MESLTASTLARALPYSVIDTDDRSANLHEIQRELEGLAHELLAAKRQGIQPPQAVVKDQFPLLKAFHQGLRDALFLEIPHEFSTWLQQAYGAAQPPNPAIVNLQTRLVELAQEQADHGNQIEASQVALAEFIVFETVRLQLLITALSSEEFELLGGEESMIDEIAWREVNALLHQPSLQEPEIRPLHVISAAANIALARNAAHWAEDLRVVSESYRQELRLRARLRAALRELRLPEAVLLENAFSSLLGGQRRELNELQAERPVALEGMSRQAMDQRVSRGRRALTKTVHEWPKRRKPALFDLLRSNQT